MADRYWVGGNANWNKTGPTGWAASSGGAAGETVPTASDAVFLDNGTGTGNVTVSAAATCASLNCTNYTGTLTINTSQTLTVAGAVTFVAGMQNVAGAGTLIVTGTATLTSGGKTLAGGFTISSSVASQVFTFSGDWTVGGLFSTTGSQTFEMSGQTLYVAGGFSCARTCFGTTIVRMTGGTWSGPGSVKVPLTFAGDVTVSGTVTFADSTMTYVSGTVTTTGSTLTFGGNTPNLTILDTNGITWNNVLAASACTLTINSLFSAAHYTASNNATNVFKGTAGFSFGTFDNTTLVSSRTITLQESVTYTVTSTLNITGQSTDVRLTLASSHATNKAVFNFSGSTQNMNWVNATRLNSSGGNPCYTNGTITTCDNWSATPVTPVCNLVYRAIATA